jgi:peptidoglycan hydrolase CwlO-like protein
LKQIKTKLIAAVLVSAVFLVGLVAVANPAKADQFQDQINALNSQISKNQAAVNAKKTEANNLANKLAVIQGEINIAQQALNLTSLQIKQTQSEIDQANRDLDRQKAILKDNLRLVYKQGEVSPLELIASSKNLSDFVAQSQYLNAIKNKINSNLKKIDQLKQDLNRKQGELNTVALQQKAQVDDIAAQKAEQQRILAATQGEQSKYQAYISQDSQRVKELKAQQAAAIMATQSNVSYGGSGGYPYAGVSYPCWSGLSCADPWGMFKRECVSYTAWKVASTGRRMPYWGGVGHAYMWPGNAISAGIPVDSSPRAGDVAIRPKLTSNPWDVGHAMYVDRVNPNGTIRVSQYNAGLDGRYSEADISPSGLSFIHF